ncbi:MAG: hypothetical protein IMX05_06600 [Hydrogenibacillus schlegelii]|nr:hypothetical protein [Hydrogenibacillus schlegelii]
MEGGGFLALDDWIYASYLAARPANAGRPDREVRRPDLAAAVLRAIGSPHEALPTVVVAGSKGKGSTAVSLAFLLRAAGLSVGLLTGPPLRSFHERIRLNGRPIDDGDFLRFSAVVEPVARGIPVDPAKGEYIGPIALWQAVGYLYFREKGADVVVAEAGRGARFDDTRALGARWAVITPIFEEHVAELGPTLADIVWHKAGAVGPRTEAVFVGRQRPDVFRLLQDVRRRGEAGGPSVRWATFGEVFGVTACAAGLRGTRMAGFVGRTSYRATLALLGRHQADNFALAVAVADAVLRSLGRGPLSPTAIERAAARVRWPGRLERLLERPLVLLDAAIHRSALDPALELVRLARPRRTHAVVGLAAGKDPGLLSALRPHVDALWYAPPTNPHLASPSAWPPEARAAVDRFFADPMAAIAAALRATPDDGALLLFGTLSFVADALRALGRDPADLGDPLAAVSARSGGRGDRPPPP